jgi:hypothetical protein
VIEGDGDKAIVGLIIPSFYVMVGQHFVKAFLSPVDNSSRQE